MRYICTNCGYVYNEQQGDPEYNIPAGSLFKDLPQNWICPVCYATKDKFDLMD